MAEDLDFTVGKLSPAGHEREQEIKGIKALCSARSYMGKDIGEIFSYRDLWANLIIDPYIELSPELVWVARGTQDGEVLGYLTGTVREDFYRLQEEAVDRDVDALRNRGLLNMVSHPMQFWGNAVSIISGLNHRTIEFLKYLKFKAREEVPRRPASPHFNVFCRHDGKGIARALIDAYLEELRRLGFRPLSHHGPVCPRRALAAGIAGKRVPGSLAGFLPAGLYALRYRRDHHLSPL